MTARPEHSSALECVVNVSEGRDLLLLDRLASVASAALIDRHSDPDHNRTVFTLAGTADAVEEAARRVASAAMAELDIVTHCGRHPRFGVVDVVPFVPLVAAPPLPTTPLRLAEAPPLDGALAARDRFATWFSSELGVPCFLYGPLPGAGRRTLPEVRRLAFTELASDLGPSRPHPRAGACAVGARHFLVAYNLWLEGGDQPLAREVAKALRGPAVRALGLDLSGHPQVSCNLLAPHASGPAEVHDRAARLLEGSGATIARCELVGLLPADVLWAVPRRRWAELGLGPDSTIEARLEECEISWR